MKRWERLRIALAAAALRAFVALLSATWRWRAAGEDDEIPRPAIFVYWHSHSFSMAPFSARLVRRGFSLAVLASLSKDGEFAARVGRGRGITIFRGSASRGGTAGLRRLYRHLRKGGSCILASDGPRGPLHEVKPGAVVLSQMAGAPVVPVAAAADRFWRLRSWDRMVVPKPFARIVVIVGEPVGVPAESDLAAGQERVARALNAVAEEAERVVETGVDPLAR